MKIITNGSHDYKVGKFYLYVTGIDITIHDTSDDQRVVMNECMSTEEMKSLAKAIYLAAVIRQESQDLLTEELQAQADEELRSFEFECGQELA